MSFDMGEKVQVEGFIVTLGPNKEIEINADHHHELTSTELEYEFRDVFPVNI